jgi:hypothetical protein
MTSKIKQWLLLQRRRQLARRDWRTRHGGVFGKHPSFRRPVPGCVEKAHRELWRPLRTPFRLDTVRLCCHLAGEAAAEIVPEELFVSEVEPCLNHYPSGAFLADKNMYDRWYGSGVFPVCLFRNIDGECYDREYRLLEPRECDRVLESLRYPVVIKPSIESGGGKDVCFPRNRGELTSWTHGRSNYIVQEIVEQHPYFRKLNEGAARGVNTLRVCAYRSVRDNRLHVLNAALRMGKAGTLDNDAAGGIACYVDERGRLNRYAVDKYGNQYTAHPDSGIVFTDYPPLPAWEGLSGFVLGIARETYLARLVSLDVCLDADGNWRVIEVNLGGQTIRFAQYAGKPFFGSFTREVIDYCVAHRDWR